MNMLMEPGQAFMLGFLFGTIYATVFICVILLTVFKN